MEGMRLLMESGRYEWFVFDKISGTYSAANGAQLTRIKTAIEENRFQKQNADGNNGAHTFVIERD